MDSKPTVTVDLDDVIFDLADSLRQFHNEYYGTTLTRSDFKTWYLHEVFMCTPDEARARLREFYATPFHDTAPLVEGADAGLKRLAEKYRIAILTARSDEFQEKTQIWIDNALPGLYDEIHYTGKTALKPHETPKSRVCIELGAISHIDDGMHNIEDVASVGIPALLYDKPWNQGQVPHGAARVRSWSDITDRLV